MLITTITAAILPSCAIASAIGPRQANRITVNVDKKHQTIEGFGFSEAFQRAYNIYNLPEPKRTEVLDLLFNTTTGAGFTIMRNGIGSSPSSQNDWMNTFLPVSPGRPTDPPKYYVWDGKDSGQLWVSQQAVKYGVKTFYGNAWSAPGFMKTNGRDSNGGGLCGLPGATCSSGDWRQAYADYLVKYVQLYAQEGVDVTHLGFVNEPDFSTSYASMQVNGNQAADFIKILHPTLAKNNLSHVAITCCEATGWNAQSQYTQQLKFAGVESMVGVITGHTYTSGISFAQPTTRKVWETECSDLSGRWSTAWYSSGAPGDGYTWANNIYTGLTTGNVSAYLWWVGTQDRATNNNNNEKLILVERDSYQVSKRLWAFAQYSRTVRPGAVRVDASGGNSLRTTAFLNTDGTLAVNVINTGASVASVSIAGTNGTSVQAWVTDNTHDMDLTTASRAGDGTITGSVPGRAIVTFVIS
ncbi:hypothetical protein DL768_008883 [Monosporascus sp. mg162]|nr:hypothetical protein DL768_008883 [Monosporascus sp. mg162]